MTDPVETVVCNSARNAESVAVLMVTEADLSQHHADEFLNDEWAEEFDRRLAAWESEAPAACPVQ